MSDKTFGVFSLISEPPAPGVFAFSGYHFVIGMTAVCGNCLSADRLTFPSPAAANQKPFFAYTWGRYHNRIAEYVSNPAPVVVAVVAVVFSSEKFCDMDVSVNSRIDKDLAYAFNHFFIAQFFVKLYNIYRITNAEQMMIVKRKIIIVSKIARVYAEKARCSSDKAKVTGSFWKMLSKIQGNTAQLRCKPCADIFRQIGQAFCRDSVGF